MANSHRHIPRGKIGDVDFFSVRETLRKPGNEKGGRYTEKASKSSKSTLNWSASRKEQARGQASEGVKILEAQQTLTPSPIRVIVESAPTCMSLPTHDIEYDSPGRNYSCSTNMKIYRSGSNSIGGIPVPSRSSSVKRSLDGRSRPAKESSNSRLPSQQKQLDDAQARIAELELEKADLESNIRRIQTHVFKRFDAPGWKPDCNEDISHKLNLLESAVRAWSKSNSISTMRHYLNDGFPYLTEKLTESLKPFAKVDKGLVTLGIPEDKASVLVQAYIMHHLYTDVFEEPFFGLNDRLIAAAQAEAKQNGLTDDKGKPNVPRERQKISGGRSRSTQAQVLYEEFMACDAQEAVSWRVQTLRQICPPEQDEDTKSAARKLTILGRQKVAEQLAKDYLTSGIRVLIKETTSTKTRASLEVLILQAAELAFSLWTQKIYLLPKYMDSRDIGSVFNNDKGPLEPHLLLNKYLHEDSTCLDGLPILVLTHPALIRYGNEDGTDFGVRSVLKSATCWTAVPTRLSST